MKTILCQEYQKDRILRQLLETSGSDFLSDVQLTTLAVQMKDDTDADRNATLLQTARLLQQQRVQFPIYAAMFRYPAFLAELVSFARQCLLWQIPASALPQRSQAEAELKDILAAAMCVDCEEKAIGPHRQQILQRIKALPELTVWDGFETDYFRYQLRQDLEKAGCQQHRQPLNAPTPHLSYALNTRQELESVAQDICRRQQTCNVILCSPAEQLPVLKQVFRRYQIPFSVMSAPVHCRIFGIYAALADFSLQKTAASLQAAITANAFSAVCDGQLPAYYARQMTAAENPTAVSQQIQSFAFQSEKKLCQTQEQLSQRFFRQIQAEVDQLKNAANPADSLQAAFHVLQKNPALQDPDELKAALQIRSLLEHTIPLVETMEDAEFLVRQIGGMTMSGQILTADFCTVSDLQHPVPPAEISYVLGCSGRCYPGFPARKGLFDEDYVSAVQGYPTLTARHDAYISQLDWIRHSASQQLFYSYSTNDYSGRQIQLAFEIESLFQTPEHTVAQSRWPLLVPPPRRRRSHTLTPEHARRLFAPDGTISGSISTIERWFACPYSYFIQCGLRVQQKPAEGLDAAAVGTMMHAVLQHAVTALGKHYPTVSRSTMEAILTPYFQDLRRLYPLDDRFLALSRSRMIDSLQTAMIFLQKMESQTSFAPEQTEYRFETDFTAGVHIKGFIDRLDTRQDQLRILDYKSSTKQLSEKRVKAGAQLQLLTYLIVAQRLFSRQPAGAYYFSFKEQNTPVISQRLLRGKLVDEMPHREEDRIALFQKNRKLAGWTFLPPEEDNDCIAALSVHYQYDLVKDCMEQLYQLFRTQLLAGRIDLDPTDHACAFCAYRSVCRFAGDCRPETPLVMKDVSLKEPK